MTAALPLLAVVVPEWAVFAACLVVVVLAYLLYITADRLRYWMGSARSNSVAGAAEHRMRIAAETERDEIADLTGITLPLDPFTRISWQGIREMSRRAADERATDDADRHTLTPGHGTPHRGAGSAWLDDVLAAGPRGSKPVVQP